MKKLMLLFAFIVLGATGVYAVNLQWTGNMNASWGNPMNWTPVKLPDAGDNVTISAPAINMPVVDAGAASCYNLTVYAGASLSVNAGCMLNVEGQVTYSGNLTVNTSGECVLNAGFNVTASANIQVNGNLRFGGSSGTFTGSGSINGSGTVTVMPSRTIEMNAYLVVNTSFSHTGIININSSRTLTVNGSFSVSGSAQMNVSTTGAGGVLFVGGNLNYSSASNINLQSNGILRFGSAGGSATFSGSTTVTGSGSVDVQATHSLHIDGNMVINTTFTHSGSLNIHAGRIVTINGSFTGSATAGITVGSDGNGGVFETTGSFNYSSSAAIQLSYDGIFRFGGTGSLLLSSNVIFNGSGSVVIVASRTVNVNATVNINCNFSHSGILNIYANRVVTVNGNFTVGLTAGINVSTTGTNGILTVGGNLDYSSSSAISLQNNGILRFGTITGAASGTFTGSATVNTTGSGSVEVQLSHALHVQGSLTINTSFNHYGNIEVHSARTLTVNGSFTASGSASLTVSSDGNNGIFQTTGSFNYSSSAHIQIMYNGIFSFGGTGSLTLYHDITFDGTGSVSIAASRTVNVECNLVINSSFNHSGVLNIYASRNVSVNGSFSTGATAEINVSTTGPGGVLQVGGNLTHSSSHQIILNNNGILRFGGGGGGGTLYGDLTVTTTGFGSVETMSSHSLSIQGSLTINTSFNHYGVLEIHAARTVTVNGSFTASGSSTINVSSDGNGGVMEVTGSFNYSSSGHILLSYNGVFRFGGSGAVLITGDVTLDGSGTVDIVISKTMNVDGTLTVNSNFILNGTINIYGSRTMKVNGSFSTTGTADVNISTTGNGGVLVLGGNYNHSSSHQVTLQNNGILSFGGTAGGSGTFTGTLTVLAAGTGSVEIQVGRSLNVEGNLTMNSSFNHNGHLEIHHDRTLVLNGGLNATGNASIVVSSDGNNGLLELTGSLNYSSSAAIELSYNGIFRFGGSGSLMLNSDVTFNGTGSVEIGTSRTVEVYGTVTVNCDFSHSGILNINGPHTFTVNGELIVSGTAELNVSTLGSGGVLVVGGNLTYHSSKQIILSNNGVLRFGSISIIGSNGTFTGTATVTAAGSGSVEVTATHNLYVNGALICNASFNHSGSLFIHASRTLTMNGTFTASGTGSVNVSHDGSGGSLVMNGNLKYNASGHIHLAYDGLFLFKGPGTGQLTGSVTFDGTGSLEIDGSRTLTVDGNMVVNCTYVHNGILNISASRTVTVNGSFTANGSAQVNVGMTGPGAMFETTGNFSYTSAAHVLIMSNGIFRFGGSGSLVLNHTMTFDGSGMVEVTTSKTLNVDAPLTVNCSFSHNGMLNIYAGRLMTVNGTLSNSGGAEIHVSTSGTGGMLLLGGNLIHSCYKEIYLEGNGILRFGSGGGPGSGTLTGNLTILATSAQGSTEIQSSHTLHVDGNLTINAGFNHSGFLDIHAGRTVNLNGSITASGSSSIVVSSDGNGGVLNTSGNLAYNSSSSIKLDYNGVFRFGGVSGTFSRTASGSASIDNLGSGSVEIAMGRSLVIDGNLTVNAPLNCSGSVYVNASRTLQLSENHEIQNTAIFENEGLVILKRNLYNYNPAPYVMGSGLFEFSGIVAQSISGQNIFQDVSVNNPAGCILNNNTTVNGIMTLMNGRVLLGTNNLLMGPAASFAGTPSVLAMIVPTGPGELRKEFPAGFTGSFGFPVGDDFTVPEYSPVTLNFTAGTFSTGSNHAGLALVNLKYPDPDITGNYLKRYWTVSQAGISNFSCNATFQYVGDDVEGSENVLSCTKVDPLPWTTYSLTDPVNHLLSATGITSFSSFTGLKSTTPPEIQELQNITIGQNVSNCYDAMQQLIVAGNGTSFVVENGGSVSLIAGVSISLLPGVLVNYGGYLNAHITTDEHYCSSLPNPLVSNIMERNKEPNSVDDHLRSPWIRIYPNPTSDIVVIDLLNQPDLKSYEQVIVYNLSGKIMIKQDLAGKAQYQLSLSGMPSGLYVIQVIAGNRSEKSKIFKN